MILTLDVKNNEIRLTSVPRDILVLRNGKIDKITHAYAYSGGTGTLRALNSNFKLDIRDFVAITMFDVEEILSEFAPIEVEINEKEREEINYRIKEFVGIKKGNSELYLTMEDELFNQSEEYNNLLLFESGLVELNKEQLLAYLRIRKTDSAFARNTRQREIIGKIINKSKQMPISNLLDISKKTASKLTTSMTQDQINEQVINLFKIISNINISSRTFPKSDNIYNNYINGVYYTDIKNRVKNIKEMNKYIQNN
jgi:anionic cell wall polymer biosynthesis LytR-Cps2A-Psr (LCP) family protein